MNSREGINEERVPTSISAKKMTTTTTSLSENNNKENNNIDLFLRYTRVLSSSIVVLIASSSSAFYIPICWGSCARKKENITRENKEEKEEKSRQKGSFCLPRGSKKVFSSRARKYTRVERNIFSKDIIILPQNLSQRA